jgi:hypothetical protein
MTEARLWIGDPNDPGITVPRAWLLNHFDAASAFVHAQGDLPRKLIPHRATDRGAYALRRGAAALLHSHGTIAPDELDFTINVPAPLEHRDGIAAHPVVAVVSATIDDLIPASVSASAIAAAFVGRRPESGHSIVIRPAFVVDNPNRCGIAILPRRLLDDIHSAPPPVHGDVQYAWALGKGRRHIEPRVRLQRAFGGIPHAASGGVDPNLPVYAARPSEELDFLRVCGEGNENREECRNQHCPR